MILMGVVNLTPDSFREETRAMTPAAIKRRVKALMDRGCSIIDFGAVSTRPGAADVPVEEEWARLEPTLALVETAGVPSPTASLRFAPIGVSDSGVPENLPIFGVACRGWRRSCEGTPAVSVDTTSAEIVRRTYGRIGRFIVNDISAGEDDPEMLPTVAELGLPYIAMHKRGNPRSMDALTEYPQGVVQAVNDYFEQFAEKAEKLGIKEWILDPGFGFAKTAEQNWELLEKLPTLRHFGRPILVGVADKRFTHTPNPFAPGQVPSSQYAERLAEERGADILRIH
ncbi:MAG: dihydropteroate synthase [Bacteroidales bacterium]|nr:dihydropteroate synthase [Bacteroidales bacterium]